jgi:hypothetical protein
MLVTFIHHTTPITLIHHATPCIEQNPAKLKPVISPARAKSVEFVFSPITIVIALFTVSFNVFLNDRPSFCSVRFVKRFLFRISH